MVTVPPEDGITNITLHDNFQPAGLREGPTNYINVTVPLHGQVTNVVHIFSGPNYRIDSLRMEPVSAASGISLSLQINDKKHIVNIATFVTSYSKQLEPSRERKRITGFNGFAQVKIIDKSGEFKPAHYFGLDSESYRNGDGPQKKPYLMHDKLHSDIHNKLPLNVPYTTSFDNEFQVHEATYSNNSFQDTLEDNVRVIRSGVVLSARRGSFLILQYGLFVLVILVLALTIRVFRRQSKVYIR